ncbi:hypothetical protein M404DRAFT_1006077 [Pisolithus tinctorius Marx 270]|uniref:Uncharacterized protein n=1 Tax=Pisolithus tinctorius Marx 270 TaxID=870435 RepID=A0A0C3NPD4_PISTI|nr:hypothetical protein M404DRAFT_1006077 [Pisolithus tinctorius Marx 270]
MTHFRQNIRVLRKADSTWCARNFWAGVQHWYAQLPDRGSRSAVEATRDRRQSVRLATPDFVALRLVLAVNRLHDSKPTPFSTNHFPAGEIPGTPSP